MLGAHGRGNRPHRDATRIIQVRRRLWVSAIVQDDVTVERDRGDRVVLGDVHER